MIEPSIKKEILAKKNVVGVGTGIKMVKGEPTRTKAITCLVEKKEHINELKNKDVIPLRYGMEQTDVIKVGKIIARDINPTDRFRPVRMGISGGHFAITAGTIGCFVKRNNFVYILTNNHVAADSNEAEIGDAFLQPGPYDGGKIGTDTIGYLKDFIPVVMSDGLSSNCPVSKVIEWILNKTYQMTLRNTRFKIYNAGEPFDNLVDAALVGPFDPSKVDKIDQPVGADINNSLNESVFKRGRTTGITSGYIAVKDLTVDVQYDAGKVARFVEQIGIMTNAGVPFSQGGDSGSAIVTNDNILKGLLFAGSDDITIANPIEHVFSLLGISGVY